MERAVIVHYFSTPMGTTTETTRYFELWCRQRLQQYVDDNMDDSNYKFFAALFASEKGFLPGKSDRWLTDDEWVYRSISLEHRRLAEMSNSNVRIMAESCRMKYFVELVRCNVTSPEELCDIFDAVFVTPFRRSAIFNNKRKH